MKISISRKLKLRRVAVIIGIFVIIGGASLAVFSTIRHNKKSASAFSYTNDELVVAENEILYIGEDGLQSERVWEENSCQKGSACTGGNWDWNEARTNKRPDHQITRTLGIPANRVFDSSYVINMNYPKTGGCPYTIWGNGSTSHYSASGCKAILTDGGGAIVKANQKIEINGVVVLGDRTIFNAPTIILGPKGRIMGHGQNGGVNGGDNSGYGGIGAHSGGQVNWYNEGPTGHWGMPQYYTNYEQNNVNYYFPLFRNDILDPLIKNYFTDTKNSQVVGGGGTAGSKALDRLNPSGQGGLGEIGIGGSGGSGSEQEDSSGTDSGAGGGGGGGYGIVFLSNSFTTSAGSLITVRGGNAGDVTGWGEGNSGGVGGAGGGGVVIIQSSTFNMQGTINTRGGKGRSQSSSRYSFHGQNGKLILKNMDTATVKKTLEPVSRAGNSNFDPYSLQVGDIVKVTLTASNLPKGVESKITDQFLYSNGAKCVYQSGYGTGPPDVTPTAVIDQIEWKIIADSDTEESFHYYCEVQ